MKLHLALLASLLSLCAAPVVAALADRTPIAPAVRGMFETKFEKLSPFTRVRVKDDTAEVLFDGRACTVVSIDGLTIEAILAFCRTTYGERAEKRFAEDLVEVLAGMKRPLARSLDLVLIDAESGARIERKGAPMTEENRRKVWEERKPKSESWTRISPFTSVRVSADTATVQFEGRACTIVSIEGMSIAKVLEHCRVTYGPLAEKRFAEDLVEVLAALGHPVGREVDLVLLDVESGARVERKRAPMTEENRRQVWEERNKRENGGK